MTKINMNDFIKDLDSVFASANINKADYDKAVDEIGILFFGEKEPKPFAMTDGKLPFKLGNDYDATKIKEVEDALDRLLNPKPVKSADIDKEFAKFELLFPPMEPQEPKADYHVDFITECYHGAIAETEEEVAVLEKKLAFAKKTLTGLKKEFDEHLRSEKLKSAGSDIKNALSNDLDKLGLQVGVRKGKAVLVDAKNKQVVVTLDSVSLS